MEGTSLDISSEIQNPKYDDVHQSKVVNSGDFTAVSNESTISPKASSYSSDEDNVIRVKKRVQRFTESDSETDKENSNKNNNLDDNTDRGADGIQRKNNTNYIFSGLDSDSDCSEFQTVQNERQSRIEIKRTKIRAKFRNLTSKPKKNDNDKNSHDESDKNSDDSDPDTSSVSKIEQHIKEGLLFKSSVCDPDTSDDEGNKEAAPKKLKQKKQQKSISNSSKPMRISAKEAMENMHKIKSESNRLLREKEVSLPYHRPKALSLKDILNRRKPAFTTDGKVMPIKMNEQQLKEYALLLEQRQKEMMELCKSDTDEEIYDKQADNEKTVTEEGKVLDSVDDQLLKNDSNNDMEIEGITIDTSKEESTLQHQILSDTKELGVSKNYDVHTNMEILQEELVIETEIYINKDTVNVEEGVEGETISKANDVTTDDNKDKQLFNVDSEKDSHLISLYYGSEDTKEIEKNKSEEFDNNDISENEIDFDDIDRIIEDAEIIEDKSSNTAILHKEPLALELKPKLTGAAGMVIDLEDNKIPKKRTGLELLKERFIYFVKLKTPEELEREREKRLKPGTQHQKLKQELEEKIAEQRSIEWAKRFEEEKQQQIELKAIRGDTSDAEEDIEKIEAKLSENIIETEESSSEEEEEEEEINETKETIRKKNPMIDDEAEVTDCDDEDTALYDNLNDEDNADSEAVDDGHNEEDENQTSGDSSDDESSESDNEQPSLRKGRILKAFEEDSDDEGVNVNVKNIAEATNRSEEKDFNMGNESRRNDENINVSQEENEVIKDSQDEPIQLAQRMNSVSDDLFTSQESGLLANNEDEICSGTQTFSILNSKLTNESININDADKIRIETNTQSYDLNNAALQSETYTENFIPSQITKSICASSQPFGEDILALCTGKFYDNEFITQTEENLNTNNDSSQPIIGNTIVKSDFPKETTLTDSVKNVKDDGNILQTIIDELHNSEFTSEKPNKYFGSEQVNGSVKKKFVIDSDEESNNDVNSKEPKKVKKIRKRKPETRVLQISDDEDDEQSNEEEETCEYNTSDIEDENDERVIEYDSEENEIEVKPQNIKKKRKVKDFFEDEAELTSEDEWVGSGDEDEADLDRMEREEGDSDVFHQGKLQKELGQIHMRDVMDQDKREVRLIQELLFEDGDLGEGHRQRKFRWKNADGEEETGMVVEGLTDTQEEEFESEELWRKQRHEREVFLRQMEDTTENPNVSFNRTTIIKANLSSKTMSSLLLEVNSSSSEKIVASDITVGKEKKTATNLPSPKKAFSIFQQNYHGSLLTRGQGALARLAALATPLAIDDDDPKIGSLGPSNRRNFVFASVTPNDKGKKVSKRKADSNADTPKLVKKLKTDENKLYNKNSLLNHL